MKWQCEQERPWWFASVHDRENTLILLQGYDIEWRIPPDHLCSTKPCAWLGREQWPWPTVPINKGSREAGKLHVILAKSWMIRARNALISYMLNASVPRSHLGRSHQHQKLPPFSGRGLILHPTGLFGRCHSRSRNRNRFNRTTVCNACSRWMRNANHGNDGGEDRDEEG